MLKKSNILKKKTIAAFLGTVIEYYDYSLYGFSASVLAKHFFSYKDQITSLVYVFLIYATGYVAKPVGSVFFSFLGDKYGRKISLKISLIGIVLPTFIIGCTPTYINIGKVSIYILIICRLFQGFFIAGEYDGAAIYILEHLDKKFRYTASALSRSMCVVGLLLGIFSVNFFNSSLFKFTYKWRIPFLLSLPLGLCVLYLRKFLVETKEFQKNKLSKKTDTSTLDFIFFNWKNILLVLLLTGGFSVTYQGAIIFMKQYLTLIFPELKNFMVIFSIFLVLFFGLSMIVSGFLADITSFQKTISINVVITLIALFLFIFGIHHKNINLVLMSSIILSISVAPFNALAHGLLIQKFPINKRITGIGIGHTLGSLLLSGTANFIMFGGIKYFHSNIFPLYYIGFFTLIYFLVAFKISKKLHKP